MPSTKKALQHTIAWTIQNIYNLNQEAIKIIDNKELDEKEKMRLLRSPNGIDYWMVNLILLLEPAIEFAKEEYPDQKQFFDWYEDKMKYLKENKMLTEECKCKGCKKE